MRRAGFTMIEIMFIVVIIGVLAAVAIPRLMVSREDACYVKLRSNLSEAQSEITRQYTKNFMQGKAMSDADLKKILDDTLVANTSAGCDFAVKSKNDVTMNIGSGNKKKSLKLTLGTDTATKSPTITCDTDDKRTGEMCKRLLGKKGNTK
ncbi:type II secretion system protein [Helicobacter sp. 23-1044]